MSAAGRSGDGRLDVPDPHLDPEVAARYDEADGATDATEVRATVDVLAELAGTGPAVELAIGTGRIGLPLAELGVEVRGVDLSEPMLDQLRAKPGAERLRLEQGDMTTAFLGDDATLVYLVFNTVMNLRTQDAQVACFANAARHLRPGGRFVVEVVVPQVGTLPPGERVRAFAVTDDHLGVDEYVDPVAQLLVSHHVRTDGERLRRSSATFRYVWPSELDLMARLAGMELEHRWADWQRSPFTADSPSHVSVWRTRRAFRPEDLARTATTP